MVRPFVPHAATRSLVFGLTCLALGCGARTTLSVGEDAGRRDGGGDAATLRDAGRDAGPPDSGPPPAPPCRSDAACEDGEVCRAEEAFTPSDLTALPLTCGRPFAGSAVGTACQGRDACDRGLCVAAGTCVRPCISETDCDDGELCREVYVLTSRSTMQTLEACVARVAAPDTVDVNIGGSLFVDLAAASFDPIDMTANTLVVYQGDADAVAVLAEIRDAAGDTVFDVTALGSVDPDWGINPVALNGFVTLAYPNGPRSPDPGVYDLGLAAQFDSTNTERTVARRTGDGTVLDLDLYLAGGNRWTSPDGSIPPGLALGVESARAILRDGAGLELGDIRVHEIVGGLRSRFSVLRGGVPPFDAPADLADLYRLSAGARRASVHVFFVRQIEGALGIASGIPGVQVLPGTGASGVAISADLIPIDELGTVIAHEVGHYLGLFHTTENSGQLSDPYDDTAECPASLDTNGDGFVAPSECAGSGAENIMFWAGSGTELSPQQGAVLRGSMVPR
ncbi:MAG: reprolysin-like metallopeptidase [Sandaracinaceae bacterium]